MQDMYALNDVPLHLCLTCNGKGEVKEKKPMPLAAYCEECGVNGVEFPDERECAWCMARHRE
jgi:DnaJ-class molecular chaperone